MKKFSLLPKTFVALVLLFLLEAFETLPLPMETTEAEAASTVDEFSERIDDILKLRTELGLEPLYESAGKIHQIKIAVLDSGFDGIYPRTEMSAKYLPGGTELVMEYPDAITDPLEEGNPHGRYVAQIIWALASGKGRGPQLRLYNAASPDNFVKAVDHLIQWEADIVVCAVNWPSLGNFDGTGFISQAVNDAVAEGVVWLQAAGNQGSLVYNGKVTLNSKKKNLLFNQNHYLRFTNSADDNELAITLSWNAFSQERTKEGTDKDLRVCVYHDVNTSTAPLGCSSERQVKTVSAPGDSLFARDRVVLRNLKSVTKDKPYLIAVFVEGGEFAASDMIRVTLEPRKQHSTPTYLFLDRTDGGEIGVPADSNALTIGDFSTATAIGPTRDGRHKPDIVMSQASVSFATKETVSGTSFATAILGGVTAVLKGIEPRLRQTSLARFLRPLGDEYFRGQGWDFSNHARGAFSEESRELLDKLFGSSNWGLKGKQSGDTSAERTLVVRKPLNTISTLPTSVASATEDYRVSLKEYERTVIYREKVEKEREVRVKTSNGGVRNHWRENYDPITGQGFNRVEWQTYDPPTYDYRTQKYWVWEDRERTETIPSWDYQAVSKAAPEDSEDKKSRTRYFQVVEAKLPRGYSRANHWVTPQNPNEVRKAAAE